MSNCILPNIFQHIKLMHLRWLTYICTYVFALAPQLCTGARSPRTISKSVCTNGVHLVLRSARLCNYIDFMCVFALIRDLYAFHLLWFFFFFFCICFYFLCTFSHSLLPIFSFSFFTTYVNSQGSATFPAHPALLVVPWAKIPTTAMTSTYVCSASPIFRSDAHFHFHFHLTAIFAARISFALSLFISLCHCSHYFLLFCRFIPLSWLLLSDLQYLFIYCANVRWMYH